MHWLCVVSSVLLGLSWGVIGYLLRTRGRAVPEDALRASEAKFSTAFRASPDAILITSIPSGEIFEANEGFTRITGVERSVAVGKTTRELDLWVDLDERDVIFEHLRRDGRVRDFDVGIRHTDGTAHPCQLSGEPITLEGRPFLLTVVRDITDRKRAESEREAVVAELEAKNAELERFTYTVSHDLKSPLVTIRGFLGLLEKDIERSNRGRIERDIDRIRSATETMGQLLDELLELSRVGHVTGDPETIDLRQLTGEVIDLLAGRIAEKEATVDVSDDLPTVVGDRARLFEVLQNLVANGLAFGRGGEPPRIEVGFRPGPGVLFVRDHGLGIDPAYHEKVFGLFERLETGIPGTGIGLALVKRIVEAHGGRVWVESEGRGKGSTFCFTLDGI